MNCIHLYNIESKQITIVNVTDSKLKELEKLQHIGGFKRFGLEIENDNVRGKKDLKKVETFINEIFN